MKKYINSFIAISAFVLCVQNLNARTEKDSISALEKKYAATLSSDEKEVKLIGCRILDLDWSESPAEEKDKFIAAIEAAKETEPELRDQTYFAEDYSYYRMYFPINSAIIDCDGVRYIANKKGVVSLTDACDISKIKILGIKKSEKVQGTSNNIIVGDSIFFKTELKQGVNDDGVTTGYIHKKEKICVFMFLGDFNMD
jgi:hypothetical protein